MSRERLLPDYFLLAAKELLTLKYFRIETVFKRLCFVLQIEKISCHYGLKINY